MPIRVANSVEKNVVSVPVKPIVVATNTPTDVLDSIIGHKAEYSGRYIQNVGANACYYAIGHDCNPTNFNGMLSPSGTLDANGFGPGNQFDASNTGQRISVYAVGGTTISVTLLKRNDNEQGSGGIIPNILQG